VPLLHSTNKTAVSPVNSSSSSRGSRYAAELAEHARRCGRTHKGPAPVLDRRMHGRKLLGLPRKRSSTASSSSRVIITSEARQHRSLRVPCGGALAEFHPRADRPCRPSSRAPANLVASPRPITAGRPQEGRAFQCGPRGSPEKVLRPSKQHGVELGPTGLSSAAPLDGLAQRPPNGPGPNRFLAVTAASINWDRRTPRSTEAS